MCVVWNVICTPCTWIVLVVGMYLIYMDRVSCDSYSIYTDCEVWKLAFTQLMSAKVRNVD